MIYISKNDYLPLAEGDWVVLRGEVDGYHGSKRSKSLETMTSSCIRELGNL